MVSVDKTSKTNLDHNALAKPVHVLSRLDSGRSDDWGFEGQI